jgi:hypothetical protein
VLTFGEQGNMWSKVSLMSRLGASLLALTACANIAATDHALPQAARVTYLCQNLTAQRALDLLSDMGDTNQELATEDLVAGVGESLITFALTDATLAMQRQAVAHALGCWWASAPERGIVYSRSQAIPGSQLNVRAYTSGLRGANWEPLALQVMRPWLMAPGTGLSHQSDIGLWSATLDNHAHAQLVQALSLLERPVPQCPPLIPDPDCPDPRARLNGQIRVSSFTDLAADLSRAGKISLSIGPALHKTQVDFVLERLPLSDLCSQFVRHDIRAQFIDGVLCLDRQPILERAHPGERRRLAVIPIAHVAANALDAELMTAAIRQRVAPSWWDMPGAALALLPTQSSLFVSADAPTLHAVLDAVDRIDRLGLAEGLSALGGP